MKTPDMEFENFNPDQAEVREPSAASNAFYVGLYRGLGYCERGPFGAFRADPLSVFMEKNLEVGN